MLKGDNQISRFRQIAKELASAITVLDGVVGVVFIGGLVRGFADRFSDVDIIAFLGRRDERLRKRIRSLGLEAQKRYGVDVDLEVHFIDEFRRWKWDEVDRWEFSRAEFVFDPEGKVREMFREKLKVGKDFWVKRIAVCSEYLKWYACPPKSDVGTVSECWVERGDLTSAHYCLNYATELVIRLVYALNREFLPAPKWRIHYLHRLKWLPKDCERLLSEATLVKGFSKEEFNRRLNAIRKMWSEILPKIKEETGLTTELIAKYYTEKILHQT